jgi:hypothetical protein
MSQPGTARGDTGHAAIELPWRMPAVTVTDAAGAAAALTLAGPRGVLLLSIPAAAGSLGAPWFLALIDRAAADAKPAAGTPWAAALDCGDAPGHALAALQAGARLLILDPACPAFGPVCSAAAEAGATVWPRRPDPSLDLRDIDLARPAGRALLSAWLAGGG